MEEGGRVGSPITLSGFNSIDFNQILTLIEGREMTGISALR